MQHPSQPERCAEHGLVCGPDGRCVVCRRSVEPEPTRTPRPSLTQRLLSWPPASKLSELAQAAGAFRRVVSSKPPTAETPSSKASTPAAEPVRVSAAPRGRSGPASLRAAMGLSPRPAEGFRVVFYSLSTCTVCQTARSYLQHHGIPFTERDVERDSAAAAEAVRLNPRRSVPTFHLGDREVLVGFEPQELEAALARLGQSVRAGTSVKPS